MVLLGVHEVLAVVRDFLARLDVDRTVLDELNVFPVADNDTGSNMVRSLTSIVAALADVHDLEAAAAVVEEAALDGRGNSGLIIGQFLAGFFSSFDGDHIDTALGLGAGAVRARRAVATPVEGTMLTVADVAAEAAARPGLSLDELVVCVADAVEATPGQLAVLAFHGVVDSGAAGLLLFFEALSDVVIGRPRYSDADGSAGLIVCNVGLVPNQATADQYSHGQHDEVELYEIQFRVPSKVVSAGELRSLLAGIGTDVVVGSSPLDLAAHLHVIDPHVAAAAISAALETRPGAKAISFDVAPIVESGTPR